MSRTSGRHRRPSGRHARKTSGVFVPSMTTTEKRLRKALKSAGIAQKWWGASLGKLLCNGEVAEEADFTAIFDYADRRGFRGTLSNYSSFSVEPVSAEEILEIDRKKHREQEARIREKAKRRSLRRKAKAS